MRLDPVWIPSMTYRTSVRQRGADLDEERPLSKRFQPMYDGTGIFFRRNAADRQAGVPVTAALCGDPVPGRPKADATPDEIKEWNRARSPT